MPRASARPRRWSPVAPGLGSTVRAPAVYGPGDRETLAYFRAVARGLALRPKLPDARLSLIHVADLAEALALAVERPPPPSVYEIDDGREGGYGYGDMAEPPAEAAWAAGPVAGDSAAGHGRRRPDERRSAMRWAARCRS